MATVYQKKIERRAYTKLIRHARKAHGECQRCGKPLDDVWESKCKKCHDDDAIRNANAVKREMYRKKRRYDICIAFGVCVGCFKRDSVPGKVRCVECATKKRSGEMRKRREAGVIPAYMRGKGVYCKLCVRPVETPGEIHCNVCKSKLSANAIKMGADYAAKRKAEGIKHIWQKDRYGKRGSNNGY